MSTVAFQCPNCGTPNPISNRFCMKCGANLITQCPRCGEEIFIGAEFCGNCGVQVETATPLLGLPIDKVKVWREIFASFNWLLSAEEESELVQIWNSKSAELGIDPVDLAQEPTIFAAAVDKKVKFGIRSAWVARPGRLTSGTWKPEWGTEDGLLWATSWRFLLLGIEHRLLKGRGQAWYFVLPYEDLVSFKVWSLGRVLSALTSGIPKSGIELKRKDDYQLLMHTEVPRPGLLDLAALMTAQDPAVKSFAIADTRDKQQIAEAFTEILKRFFEEVSKLSADVQKRK